MRRALEALVGTETPRSERVEQLKRDIAARDYAVDADQVADAIVRKLRLVRRGLEALSVQPEADRSPEDQMSDHRAS
jgi:hypothetical protein